MKKEKIVVVMPAYNAASTIAKTVADIPQGIVDRIILVDDASSDDTVNVARGLGLTVYTHDRNKGYGANQKTCYELALQSGAEYIIMIHPDYQYDCRLIPAAIEILRLRVCDIILGNRVRTRAECLAGGMPKYKYFANRILTLVENIILGQNLGEFHSGFRAYRRDILTVIGYEGNSDNFVFDTQILLQAIHFGFTVGDIPMPVRYFKEASSINFLRSVRYGLETLFYLFLFLLQKTGLVQFSMFQAKRAKD
jgi:glycosyltransferase involved in cell wall biosynthesis